MREEEVKIEAVAGCGRVCSAAGRAAAAAAAVVFAALAVIMTIGGVMSPPGAMAGALSAAVLVACAAVYAAYYFVRQLKLKAQLKIWRRDEVRLPAQIIPAGGATLPNEMPLPCLNAPAAVVQLPAADNRLLIVFRYNNRKIVKTVSRKTCFRKYANQKTDILYSPAYDIVMLIGLTERI